MKKLLKLAQKLNLYNGTSSIFVKQILQSGSIKTRQNLNKKIATAQDDGIYLIKFEEGAKMYANEMGSDEHTIKFSPKHNDDHFPCVLHIEIDTEEDHLEADEDLVYDFEYQNYYDYYNNHGYGTYDISYKDEYLNKWINVLIKNNLVHKSGNELLYNIKDVDISDKKILELFRQTFTWKDSFNSIGTCVFIGDIPINKIKQIDVYCEDKKYELEDINYNSFINLINRIKEKFISEEEKLDNRVPKEIPKPIIYIGSDKRINNYFNLTVYKNLNTKQIINLNKIANDDPYKIINSMIINDNAYYFNYLNIDYRYFKKDYVVRCYYRNDTFMIDCTSSFYLNNYFDKISQFYDTNKFSNIVYSCNGNSKIIKTLDELKIIK